MREFNVKFWGILLGMTCLLFSGAFAQTDSLNIVWDPNTDPDIYRYLLQRSVNSTNNFVNFQYVFHPTTRVTDNSVQPGNLYAYRVAAIDSAGNMSGWSNIDAAGIPLIQLQLTNLITGQDTTFALSNILTDPDNTTGELQVLISQESNVTVTVQAGNLVISPSPPNYVGPASFTMRVEDPDTLYDLQSFSFQFIDNTPPVFDVNVPNPSFDEDNSFAIFMDTVVTVSNYTEDQLTWGFVTGANLQYNYDSNTRTVVISSQNPNWFGQEQMIAIAIAPDQSSASDTFMVTINSVNDAPVINLTQLQISSNPDSNIIDLKPYSSDVDHSDLQLDWTFFGYTNFDFQWVDQANKIIKIIPLNNVTSESGSFRVVDPAGAADTATVSIEVTSNPTVFTVTIPDIGFDEDQSYQIQMDSVVFHTNYPPDQISWAFTTGPNLSYNYNAANRLLTIQSSNPNWFGQEQITAIATAPDQSTASDSFMVTIHPVNDAPTITLQTLYISSDPDSNIFDLNSFALDVDNSTSELNWEFWGYTHFNIVWVDQTAKLIQIIPLDTVTTESGFFRVFDPQNAADTALVTFIVINNPQDVFLVDIPDQTFPEDQSTQISLDTTVFHSNYPPSQISWSFVAGSNLRYTYNATSRMITIQSKNADWFGQDFMIATATDPDNQSVNDTFQVVILPVNDPPNISMSTLFVTDNPDSNLIDLTQYAVDVDNTPLDLDWSFWGYTNFLIEWFDATNKIIRIIPLNNVTSETGFFRVADPAGEADTAQVTIEVLDNGQPVFEVNVPNPNFDEDTQFVIQMDTCLRVSEYPPSQINWTFEAGPDLQYFYSAVSRKLTIQSKTPDWYGVDVMIAIASAPDQSTRADTFQVTIRPVNDAPQASINNLFVSPFSNNLYDLKLYASDVDNSPQELDWQFWGYTQFTIEWYDPSEKIIQITPNLNASSQTGFFRVNDPGGAADTSLVTITYLPTNTAPHLKMPPNLTIAEDSSIVLDLVKYVIDSTNTVSEMTWQFAPGPNLSVQMDPATYQLYLYPTADWYGTTNLGITVTDPFGLSDQQQVAVTVENRNDLENFVIQNSADDQVTFDVQTELPSILDVSYWYNTYQIITISMVNYQRRHTVTLQNLLPDTTYHFKIKITDENGRVLTIKDSTFQTGKKGTNLTVEKLIVYPNPIKPSEGHNEMIFLNLPENTRKISLYTILGEKIYEEEIAENNQREYRIDIVNNSRIRLPSGLYIYMIKSTDSQVLKSGKIVVIR